MSYIEFDKVSKIYKMGEVEIKALDEVSFGIDKGEFVVILGASGAGKSTILNILGGMDTATSGSVVVDEAMKQGSKDRYFQDVEDDVKKLVPEGIVGRVAYKGELNESMLQFIGGLRAGMGYCGSASIKDLQEKGRFVRITAWETTKILSICRTMSPLPGRRCP